MSCLPSKRTRILVGICSGATVGLELILMRQLSIRFWHHFAYMVIGVGLLGFGASGTLLAMAGDTIAAARRRWLLRAALALACCIPASLWGSRLVPLDPYFMGWNLVQECIHILALELVLCLPFLLAGSIVGIALADAGVRPGGKYAASLVGSAAGAACSAFALAHVDTDSLLLLFALACWVSGLSLLGLERPMRGSVREALLATLALGLLVCFRPGPPPMAPYKSLPAVHAMPGSRILASANGPLGRIDAVAGPNVHHAPGLSLNYAGTVPPHVLLCIDGEAIGAVSACSSPAEWRFMDATTGAVGYHLRREPDVLVIGAGAGSDIGLAVHHRSQRITALEMNPQLIALMLGPLAAYGGSIYAGPNVSVLNREARGHLQRTSDAYDLIQLPAVDAFGASGAGLYAAQECYLYTVEAFSAMLDRLNPSGLLCVTRWARTPPRDGLRILDTAAVALRRRGLDPSRHLAMLRSWATVTVVVSLQPLAERDCAGIRSFCDERSFDLCWMPGLEPTATNRFHVLERPQYYLAARALLSGQRRDFLRSYRFDVKATTDDRPYFHHFLRCSALPGLRAEAGRRSVAFWELASLLAVAAFVQSLLLAVLLLALPAAILRRRRSADGLRPRSALGVIAYFSLIGLGFMFLEMGFLQKLTLYLAHPVYSAAVVIACFLLFAGAGSTVSGSWRCANESTIRAAGAVIAALGIAAGAGLDQWLRLTQSLPLPARIVLAACTIAPLAFAMGHMFPTGLRLLTDGSARPFPLAWAANGCMSVIATVAAPLLAMRLGFRVLMLVAAAVYVAAVLAVPGLRGGRAGEGTLLAKKLKSRLISPKNSDPKFLPDQ